MFGWIWPKTRRLNLICIVGTTFSWFILGLKYGIGYCPLTHWEWMVKERLGEHNLPYSFITYYGEKIANRHLNPAMVNKVTGIAYATAVVCSVYFNFFYRNKKKSFKRFANI
jgi:hypothetical protein